MEGRENTRGVSYRSPVQRGTQNTYLRSTSILGMYNLARGEVACFHQQCSIEASGWTALNMADCFSLF